MVHDMTQGKLFPILVKFTIPLVLGNLLQLTYNAVDSIVVGRFVGATALAAVGTSNPLMTLIILFEQGICLGTGVLIGMMYGAKQMDRLRREEKRGLAKSEPERTGKSDSGKTQSHACCGQSIGF